jgi:hypothetical protein
MFQSLQIPEIWKSHCLNLEDFVQKWDFYSIEFVSNSSTRGCQKVCVMTSLIKMLSNIISRDCCWLSISLYIVHWKSTDRAICDYKYWKKRIVNSFALVSLKNRKHTKSWKQLNNAKEIYFPIIYFSTNTMLDDQINIPIRAFSLLLGPKSSKETLRLYH